MGFHTFSLIFCPLLWTNVWKYEFDENKGRTWLRFMTALSLFGAHDLEDILGFYHYLIIITYFVSEDDSFLYYFFVWSWVWIWSKCYSDQESYCWEIPLSVTQEPFSITFLKAFFFNWEFNENNFFTLHKVGIRSTYTLFLPYPIYDITLCMMLL